LLFWLLSKTLKNVICLGSQYLPTWGSCISHPTDAIWVQRLMSAHHFQSDVQADSTRLHVLSSRALLSVRRALCSFGRVAWTRFQGRDTQLHWRVNSLQRVIMTSDAGYKFSGAGARSLVLSDITAPSRKMGSRAGSECPQPTPGDPFTPRKVTNPALLFLQRRWNQPLVDPTAWSLVWECVAGMPSRHIPGNRKAPGTAG